MLVYTVVLVTSSKLILPSIFTYAQARESGLSKAGLYRLCDEGRIERLSRGVYRRTDHEIADLDIVEIVQRAPQGVLCLTTALAHHGLTDDIPQLLDVALPRGTRTPKIGAPVSWHHFDRRTFEVGRQDRTFDSGIKLGIYSPERSIVDAFRTRAHSGDELAYGSLKTWLRLRNVQPASLLKLAAHFPRVVAPISQALEILL